MKTLVNFEYGDEKSLECVIFATRFIYKGLVAAIGVDTAWNARLPEFRDGPTASNIRTFGRDEVKPPGGSCT